MSKAILNKSATLMDAIRGIEATSKRLAVVLSDDNEVLGTLTDGDIRRKILQGHALTTLATDAMNSAPVIAYVNTSDSALRELLFMNNIRALPLIDRQNKYVRTLHEDELTSDDAKVDGQTFSAAIIMAGGEGTRLRPLTDNLPKPMVEINGIPLLERQVRCLCKMGIKLIYISVNYLSDIIKQHFGDGHNLGVEIHYLQEKRKLGTAGALSLLPELPNDGPILVMNGDILTTSDFINLFHFHVDHQAHITTSAVDYRIEIPYGVIEHDGTEVRALKEKPSQRFLCNAGLYALSPGVIKKIPVNTFWNMTTLIEQCLSEGYRVCVFPVHEYWSDIGTPEDLEKARKEFTGESL